MHDQTFWDAVQAGREGTAIQERHCPFGVVGICLEGSAQHQRPPRCCASPFPRTRWCPWTPYHLLPSRSHSCVTSTPAFHAASTGMPFKFLIRSAPPTALLAYLAPILMVWTLPSIIFHTASPASPNTFVAVAAEPCTRSAANASEDR